MPRLQDKQRVIDHTTSTANFVNCYLAFKVKTAARSCRLKKKRERGKTKEFSKRPFFWVF